MHCAVQKIEEKQYLMICDPTIKPATIVGKMLNDFNKYLNWKTKRELNDIFYRT